jgi:hypothetical protein
MIVNGFKFIIEATAPQEGHSMQLPRSISIFGRSLFGKVFFERKFHIELASLGTYSVNYVLLAAAIVPSEASGS